MSIGSTWHQMLYTDVLPALWVGVLLMLAPAALLFWRLERRAGVHAALVQRVVLAACVVGACLSWWNSWRSPNGAGPVYATAFFLAFGGAWLLLMASRPVVRRLASRPRPA